ncbi:MAG: hypothetical protein ACJAZM_002894 [Cyclobacteriaceae bacterium]|jgi:hypothetical protein
MSAECGYQLRAGKLTSTLSGYLKTNQCDQVNTDIAGFEIFARYKLAKRLFADISYRFIDMKESQEGQKITGTYDLNYLVRGGFEWQSNSLWTLGARTLFRQGVYFSPVLTVDFSNDLNAYEPIYVSKAERERLPGYQIVDLNISQLFCLTDKMSGVLFGSMSNVLDRKNIPEIGCKFFFRGNTTIF